MTKRFYHNCLDSRYKYNYNSLFYVCITDEFLNSFRLQYLLILKCHSLDIVIIAPFVFSST